jgi:MFS family permease
LSNGWLHHTSCGPLGVAGVIGPFLGGWLVEWNWRTIFLINLPLGAPIVVIALRHVRENRDTESAPGLDGAGTVVVAVGLGADIRPRRPRRARPDLLAAVGLGVLFGRGQPCRVRAWLVAHSSA